MNVATIIQNLQEAYFAERTHVDELEASLHETNRRWQETKVELDRAHLDNETWKSNVDEWKELSATWEQRALAAESKEIGLKKTSDELLVTNVTLECERDQARRTESRLETRLEQVQRDKERLIKQYADACRELEKLKPELLLAQNEVAHLKQAITADELMAWRLFADEIRGKMDAIVRR